MPKEANGTLDDLSEEQLAVLSRVRQHVAERNLLDSRRANDWNLLRFCRARHFDEQKTIEMIEKFSLWFNTNFHDIESTDFASYDKLRALYCHGFHKTDKGGRPLYFERVCELNAAQLFENYSDEELTRYYVQSYERALHIVLPECSRAANRRIDQCTTVIDLSGVNTLSLFVGKTKQFLMFAMDIAQNYYPELLHRTFIVNAGYFFSSIWMVIRGWLDPSTQAKITICSGSGKAELLNEIDAENLPTYLGGKSEADIRRDDGPWKEELERSRSARTVFHGDPALIERWYPPAKHRSARE